MIGTERKQLSSFIRKMRRQGLITDCQRLTRWELRQHRDKPGELRADWQLGAWPQTTLPLWLLAILKSSFLPLFFFPASAFLSSKRSRDRDVDVVDGFFFSELRLKAAFFYRELLFWMRLVQKLAFTVALRGILNPAMKWSAQFAASPQWGEPASMLALC